MAQTAMVEKTVYDFSELSETAKYHAISEYAADHGWWESAYEDFVQILDIFGFDVEEYQNGRKTYNIEFSGFSHQGSYAAFSGNYNFRKGIVKEIKEYAPRDTELHNIAKNIVEMQKTAFYSLSAKFTYSNYRGWSIDMEDSRRQYGWCDSEKPESQFREIIKDLAGWLYKSLENEYDHLTSHGSFQECCDANEWQFDANGNIDSL